MAETEEDDLFAGPDPAGVEYTDDDIKTLPWNEHIRRRPGMYIGKLGDGSSPDDGIYVLLKEVIDNSIDEYMMGYGRQIIVTIIDSRVTVRDYGRGIPQGKLVEATSSLMTGGKFDSPAFKKSIGLNGVGIKAVNAMSTEFTVRSIRDGKVRSVTYSKGVLIAETELTDTTEETGTETSFIPDAELFRDFQFREEFIVPLLKNYTYLNTGLTILFNEKKFSSRNGLRDLLKDYMSGEPLYPVIHFRGDDIEIAVTHAHQYGEEYYSFVNGQHTTQGGTHLTAFKDAFTRTVKDFYGKNFEPADIRNGIVAAISIKVQEPVFESQTKTRLGSRDIGPEGPTVAKFIGDFIKKELDNYLHRDRATADLLQHIIVENEKERKAMAGVTKKAREQAKRTNLHNKKLLDCLVHYNDPKKTAVSEREQQKEEERQREREQSSIFITEGDSAAGSITKIRDVRTQAVFSLRGKPKNTYGKTKKIVYENEEFNLLQAALNIEEGIDGLRYNKVIIATDADVDGMHIRLLLLTYFLQFFPDLVREGHVYILQTPLFRVRDKNASKRAGRKSADKEKDKTRNDLFYCYTDEERIAAINRLGTNAEITRFKGLGEISPDEFREFIGENMRADRVALHREDGLAEMLRFYMGKNTIERQNFIIDNLVVEDDSQIS
ncbi:MAG: toprim domain-containing protein [Clostridium sp.]|nr:toprim domain-containing protein [Clostridium sp.]